MHKEIPHTSSAKETEIRSLKQTSTLSVVLLQEHNFLQLCYSVQQLRVAFWVSTNSTQFLLGVLLSFFLSLNSGSLPS